MTETDRKKAANSGYLTTQEVADRLRVTQRTVYNWISNELLEADKAGPKIWLISEAQLQAFLARSRPKPRRTFEMQGADPSKWGRAGQKAGKRATPAAAAGSPPAPAVQSRPLANLRLAEAAAIFRERFGEPTDLDAEDLDGDEGAYGVLPPALASRPSLPPANIPSANKKRGGRRR